LLAGSTSVVCRMVDRRPLERPWQDRKERGSSGGFASSGVGDAGGAGACRASQAAVRRPAFRGWPVEDAAGQILQILQTFAPEARMYIKQFVWRVASLGLLDACLTVSLGG
jgi:hypothetical protein